MLPPARALLLDFGGVIADGPDHPEWLPAMADEIGDALAVAGAAPVPTETIISALTGQDRAPDEFWRAAAPAQTSYQTYWGEVVGAGWPPAARAALAAHGPELSRRYMELRHAPQWRLRDGMAELLAEAAQRAVPVAVVSNTLFGSPHREFLAREGVGQLFAAQFYSDEEGVRKPNPEFALRAVAALGVDPADCWFVGDTVSRDILVARRAGLGAAVLMRSQRREPSPPEGAEPDAVVADPVELRALLAEHWPR